MNHQSFADETLFPTYPPHQLISSLRQVFGSSETSKEIQINDVSTSSISKFTELVQLVTEHPVFQEEKLPLEEPKLTSSQNTATATTTPCYNKNARLTIPLLLTILLHLTSQTWRQLFQMLVILRQKILYLIHP
jgi:hypothetical protein